MQSHRHGAACALTASRAATGAAGLIRPVRNESSRLMNVTTSAGRAIRWPGEDSRRRDQPRDEQADQD